MTSGLTLCPVQKTWTVLANADELNDDTAPEVPLAAPPITPAAEPSKGDSVALLSRLLTLV